MPVRFLRRALLPGLALGLILTGCSKVNVFKKKAPAPAIAAAADAATASSTSYSVTLVETDLQRRATIGSGSIKLNAPLAQATEGTWSLRGSPGRGLLPAGRNVAAALQENRSGKVRVSHSGVLTILAILDKDGGTILKIMGPPHGNGIKDHWYYQGNDSGLATVAPRT